MLDPQIEHHVDMVDIDARRGDDRRAARSERHKASMSPAALGIPVNNVKQLLFKMVRNGEVMRTGRGNYADPMITDNSITNEHATYLVITVMGDRGRRWTTQTKKPRMGHRSFFKVAQGTLQ